MLRPIAPDETQAVAAMWCAGWRIGHADIVPAGLVKFRNVAQFHDRILDSLDDCFVSGPADQITGFIRLKDNELDQFYVAPDQIGTGTAQALMIAAEQMLRTRGVTHAFLFASVGNDRAVRFYEKCGWRNMGARTEGVETEVGPFEMDVYRLEKTLDA